MCVTSTILTAKRQTEQSSAPMIPLQAEIQQIQVTQAWHPVLSKNYLRKWNLRLWPRLAHWRKRPLPPFKPSPTQSVRERSHSMLLPLVRRPAPAERHLTSWTKALRRGLLQANELVGVLVQHWEIHSAILRKKSLKAPIPNPLLAHPKQRVRPHPYGPRSKSVRVTALTSIRLPFRNKQRLLARRSHLWSPLPPPLTLRFQIIYCLFPSIFSAVTHAGYNLAYQNLLQKQSATRLQMGIRSQGLSLKPHPSDDIRWKVYPITYPYSHCSNPPASVSREQNSVLSISQSVTYQLRGWHKFR